MRDAVPLAYELYGTGPGQVPVLHAPEGPV